MIKLKELVLDVIKEMDLTPDDLKKFNRIMNGQCLDDDSIHCGDEDELEFAKKGFGYGGPSNVAYGRKAPDRPYRSDKGSVGASWVRIPAGISGKAVS
jgi:hypothetical protein